MKRDPSNHEQKYKTWQDKINGESLTQDREKAIANAGYMEIQRPPEHKRIRVTELLLI